MNDIPYFLRQRIPQMLACPTCNGKTKTNVYKEILVWPPTGIVALHRSYYKKDKIVYVHTPVDNSYKLTVSTTNDHNQPELRTYHNVATVVHKAAHAYAFISETEHEMTSYNDTTVTAHPNRDALQEHKCATVIWVYQQQPQVESTLVMDHDRANNESPESTTRTVGTTPGDDDLIETQPAMEPRKLRNNAERKS
jgi:hypothetical protein